MSSYKESTKIPAKKTAGKHSSISRKISWSLLAVLVPALIGMITIAGFMASGSISGLNTQLIDAQTDYAVSVVDDFFSGKIAIVSLYENDSIFGKYFHAVATPDDIGNYEYLSDVTQELNNIMAATEDEQVLQAWIADERTDCYVIPSGEYGKAGLDDLEWYHLALAERKTAISNPYVDGITGKNVVTIVTPVYYDSEIAGFMGLDVTLDSLSELISGIHVGEHGYMELYVYSNDPLAVNKNVDELDITDEYKQKVKDNYNGNYHFTYQGNQYTSVFRDSETTDWLAIATLPVSEMNATRNHLISILAVLAIVVLALLVFIIITIIRRVTKPLSEISGGMQEFARGNLNVELKTMRNDEIGLLADSTRSAIRSLKEMIQDISYILGEISRGNLEVAVKGNYVGDFQDIRNALEQIIESLNTTLKQIKGAAEQVSVGSEQVSEGAQSLAQGASEQAGTVEELAASIHEISRKVNSNADHSDTANEKAAAVGMEAVESDRRMHEMLKAMKEIQESSHKIGSILKVIEDIAFQTNILSLNAAVEAARAGDAGKGFSVVAGEVRNLAAKSSEAAKTTGALIDSSLDIVENGVQIADETAMSLQNVKEGAGEVADALAEITKASSEQADSVAHITRAISQISNVTQGNSATAEESAAASEELSAQAVLLEELIAKFKM
ncbi:methyl-accepting chemotaxis protein [Blautia producta]|uniref:methyl-accepting chemotaxis protein n=1 Tax=Blautia producta TaxID=33035 RepID=UPI00210E7B45|nr:methyl-accepting chemotaxis protein [Blautia producta]MCQ5125726.1 methyl-accepting chemotaxis protein [Blautia producta]